MRNVIWHADSAAVAKTQIKPSIISKTRGIATTMDIPAALAQGLDLPPNLHLQTRKIRNIEVGKSDLLPLILGKKKTQHWERR